MALVVMPRIFRNDAFWFIWVLVKSKSIKAMRSFQKSDPQHNQWHKLKSIETQNGIGQPHHCTNTIQPEANVMKQCSQHTIHANWSNFLIWICCHGSKLEKHKAIEFPTFWCLNCLTSLLCEFGQLDFEWQVLQEGWQNSSAWHRMMEGESLSGVVLLLYEILKSHSYHALLVIAASYFCEEESVPFGCRIRTLHSNYE